MLIISITVLIPLLVDY